MRLSVNAAPLGRLAAKARAIAEGLGRSWTVELPLAATPREPYPTLRPRKAGATAQPTNADVALANAEWLTPVTDVARARLHAALADAWRRGIHNGGALMMVAGAAWRRVLVDRARGVLRDTRPTNTPAWRERKARLGLSTRPGEASGQLARALEASTPVVRKVT